MQYKKTTSPLQLINDQKRKRFEVVKKYLIDNASNWESDDKTMWGIENDVHVQTTNKYLRGEIGSIILAEVMAEHIKLHIANKKSLA